MYWLKVLLGVWCYISPNCFIALLHLISNTGWPGLIIYFSKPLLDHNAAVHPFIWSCASFISCLYVIGWKLGQQQWNTFECIVIFANIRVAGLLLCLGCCIWLIVSDEFADKVFYHCRIGVTPYLCGYSSWFALCSCVSSTARLVATWDTLLEQFDYACDASAVFDRTGSDPWDVSPVHRPHRSTLHHLLLNYPRKVTWFSLPRDESLSAWQYHCLASLPTI